MKSTLFALHGPLSRSLFFASACGLSKCQYFGILILNKKVLIENKQLAGLELGGYYGGGTLTGRECDHDKIRRRIVGRIDLGKRREVLFIVVHDRSLFHVNEFAKLEILGCAAR
jgi:hypothetical protein